MSKNEKDDSFEIGISLGVIKINIIRITNWSTLLCLNIISVDGCGHEYKKHDFVNPVTNKTDVISVCSKCGKVISQSS